MQFIFNIAINQTVFSELLILYTQLIFPHSSYFSLRTFSMGTSLPVWFGFLLAQHGLLASHLFEAVGLMSPQGSEETHSLPLCLVSHTFAEIRLYCTPVR